MFAVPDNLKEKTAEIRNVLIPVGQTNARDKSSANDNNQTTEENTRNRYVTRSGQRVRFELLKLISRRFRVRVVNCRTQDVLIVFNF